MPIDTVKYYNPKMNHPIYAKLTFEEQNDYRVWNEYEIRIPDENNGDEGPYNYIHNAILVAKTTGTWENIPALLKGYCAKTRDAEEAIKRIHPLGETGEFSADDELVLLIFMRKDEVKSFITSGDDVLIPQDAEIEDVDSYTE